MSPTPRSRSASRHAAVGVQFPARLSPSPSLAEMVELGVVGRPSTATRGVSATRGASGSASASQLGVAEGREGGAACGGGEPNVVASMPSMLPNKSRPGTSSKGVKSRERLEANQGRNRKEKDLVQLEYSAPLDVKFAELLQTDSLTDVEFLVGEGEKKIRAHKLVLAVSSPVFMVMFFGSIKCESVIKIPDCDSEAFQILIYFIYGIASSFPKLTDESLTLPVLYVAHKYDVKRLQELCSRKLSSILNVWNVLSVLETAEMYHLDALVNECWSLIQSNTRSVLNFHLQDIGYSMLLRIVQNENLSVDEVKLFELLNTWAENECEKEELIPTIDNKLRRLGDCLKYIRYPIMSASDFANKVATKGLLTNDQVATILTYICSSQSNREFMHMDFPVTKRRNSDRSGLSDLAQHLPPLIANSHSSAMEALLFRTSANSRVSTAATHGSFTAPSLNQNVFGGVGASQNQPQNLQNQYGNAVGHGQWNAGVGVGQGQGFFNQNQGQNPGQNGQQGFQNGYNYQQPTYYFGAVGEGVVGQGQPLQNQNAPQPQPPQQQAFGQGQGGGWTERQQHGSALSYLRATLEAHQRQQNTRRLNGQNPPGNLHGGPGFRFNGFNRRLGGRRHNNSNAE